MPWIALGGYSVCSALLTANGRLDLGMATALSGRYTTFALPIWVSVVPMLWIATAPGARPGRLAALRFPVLRVSGGAIMLLIAVSLPYTLDQIHIHSLHRAASAALVQWSPTMLEAEAIRHRVYPDPSAVEALAPRLAAAGRLSYPLIQPADVATMIRPGEAAGVGRIDELTVSTSGYHLRGWSRISDEHRPADAVVLTTLQGEAIGRLVAVVEDVGYERRDVARAFSDRSLRYSGWQKHLSPQRLNPGETLAAWAWNARTGGLSRMGGEVVVPPPAEPSPPRPGQVGTPAPGDAPAGQATGGESGQHSNKSP